MQSSLIFENLKTERYFSQDDIIDKKKVKVYIRTVSRKSIKIELPSQIQISQLKDIILKKFNISLENQVIYLKGVCINFNMYLLLENNWIIHAINKLQVQLSEITVDIRTKILKKDQEIFSKYTFDPKIKVKTFIQENILKNYNINFNQVLLIESGRILKQNLTFQKQNIQSGTTINLIHCVKELKFSIKPKSSLFQQEKNSMLFSKISDYKSQEKPIIKNSLDKKMPIKNPKITKTKFCQIHYIKGLQSNISESPIKASQRLKRKDSQLRSSINVKNITIQIGQRQCNCNKECKEVKSPKFITDEDKKKLSREIREHNLQKLLISKLRKDGKMEQEPMPKKKKMIRTNSLHEFNWPSLNENSKSLKLLPNPQKLVTF